MSTHAHAAGQVPPGAQPAAALVQSSAGDEDASGVPRNGDMTASPDVASVNPASTRSSGVPSESSRTKVWSTASGGGQVHAATDSASAPATTSCATRTH